jgi:hypothetical protein
MLFGKDLFCLQGDESEVDTEEKVERMGLTPDWIIQVYIDRTRTGSWPHSLHLLSIQATGITPMICTALGMTYAKVVCHWIQKKN